MMLNAGLAEVCFRMASLVIEQENPFSHLKISSWEPLRSVCRTSVSCWEHIINFSAQIEWLWQCTAVHLALQLYIGCHWCSERQWECILGRSTAPGCWLEKKALRLCPNSNIMRMRTCSFYAPSYLPTACGLLSWSTSITLKFADNISKWSNGN